MPVQTIILESDVCLPSCITGQLELSVGEEVKLTLEPKNPLWPPFIIATVEQVLIIRRGREYILTYNDEDLNGGPAFEGCDIADITPYCCCDRLLDTDQVNDNGNGTGSVENLDGSDPTCFITCPPEGTAPGTYPHLQPDGTILWQGPPPDADTTYELTGVPGTPLEFVYQVILTGSDGSTYVVEVPDNRSPFPTFGTYAPDPATGLITIPFIKQDHSTGGVAVIDGYLIFDTSSLENNDVISFTLNPLNDNYRITLEDGTFFEQPAATVNTDPITGVTTIVGANGQIANIPPPGPDVTGFAVNCSTDEYEIYDNAGNIFRAAAATVFNDAVTDDWVITDACGREARIPQPITVNGYDVVGNNYRITLSDGTTFDVPITRTAVNGTDITITDAQGNVVTIFNNPGGFNTTAQPGDDACSRRITHTDSIGTTQSFPGFGWVNQIVVDPGSSEHTNAVTGDTFTLYGTSGENPTVNNGLYLPANDGETRGTGPDFVKTISRKTGCEVLTEVKTGRRAGNTVVIDHKFYSNTPRYEREDHPYLRSEDIPPLVKNTAQVFRFQSGYEENINISSSVPVALNFSETHTVQHLTLNGNFRTSGTPDFSRLHVTNLSGSFFGSFGNRVDDNIFNMSCVTLRGNYRVDIGDIVVDSPTPITNVVSLAGTGIININKVDVINSQTMIGMGGDRVSLNVNYARGGEQVTAPGGIVPTIHVIGDRGLVTFGEVIGAKNAIRVASPAGVTRSDNVIRGNKAISYMGYLPNYINTDFEGVISNRSCQNTVFEIDQVINESTREGPVVGIMDECSVTYKSCKFIQNFPGIDHSVIKIGTGSAGIVRNVVFDNCVAKVADPLTPVFFHELYTTRVGISGTFKTNSTVLATTITGSFTIVNGTIELGVPVI